MAAAPKPKFMMLGKSKFVHVVRTKAYDLKHSQCQYVRKLTVAGTINYRDKGLSPEAAMELDPCPHCEPGVAIKQLMGPEKAKEVRKQAMQDTLEKMRPESKRRKDKPAIKVDPPNRKAAAKRKSETGDKPPSKPTMTKTGPKSLGGDLDKANILKEFAEEHGWKVKVSEDKPGYKLVAKRGKETITCWFDGGKYDLTRTGFIKVEGSGWQGKLRAAHACRRQMAAEGRDRPHPQPGAGRSAPRGPREEPTPETESPEDALKRVPFLLDDDDVTIIDAIKGRTIRWRNGVSGAVEEATLPGDPNGKKRQKISLNAHPKTGRRMLDFFEVSGVDSATGKEVYGPERVVALEKIIRVL